MRGFTLIEVIIYIALLGLLLITALSTLYPLMRTAEMQAELVSDTLEVSFVTQKIAWLISQHATIEIPSENATSSLLTISTPHHETHSMRLQNGAIELSLDSEPFIPITKIHTTVQSFVVTHVPPDQIRGRALEITFVLNNTSYGPIRYDSFY